MRKNIALSLLTALLFAAPAHAEEVKITNQLIQAQNNEMEEVLTTRDPKKTINFLHSHIDDAAIYQIQVNNPYLPNNKQHHEMNMNKEAYIKTFIDGLHYVDSYDVEITTENIEISSNGQAALAKQVMTEEGVMLNPHNLSDTGIPFVSKTTCQIYYTINEGHIQSNKAKCSTQTSQTNDA